MYLQHCLCLHRETEYYDYGHGEAQESYESYGMSKCNYRFQKCTFIKLYFKLGVFVFMIITAFKFSPFVFVFFFLSFTAEDDWEGGWAAGGGGGGKTPAGRQNKSAPRPHPYPRPF